MTLQYVNELHYQSLFLERVREWKYCQSYYAIMQWNHYDNFGVFRIKENSWTTPTWVKYDEISNFVPGSFVHLAWQNDAFYANFMRKFCNKLLSSHLSLAGHKIPSRKSRKSNSHSIFSTILLLWKIYQITFFEVKTYKSKGNATVAIKRHFLLTFSFVPI